MAQTQLHNSSPDLFSSRPIFMISRVKHKHLIISISEGQNTAEEEALGLQFPLLAQYPVRAVNIPARRGEIESHLPHSHETTATQHDLNLGKVILHHTRRAHLMWVHSNSARQIGALPHLTSSQGPRGWKNIVAYKVGQMDTLMIDLSLSRS